MWETPKTIDTIELLRHEEWLRKIFLVLLAWDNSGAHRCSWRIRCDDGHVRLVLTMFSVFCRNVGIGTYQNVWLDFLECQPCLWIEVNQGLSLSWWSFKEGTWPVKSYIYQFLYPWAQGLLVLYPDSCFSSFFRFQINTMYGDRGNVFSHHMSRPLGYDLRNLLFVFMETYRHQKLQSLTAFNSGCAI